MTMAKKKQLKILQKNMALIAQAKKIYFKTTEQAGASLQIRIVFNAATMGLGLFFVINIQP